MLLLLHGFLYSAKSSYGGYQKWLTPTAGQGKWAEYVSYVRGGTANTSSTNFYTLDGGAETLNWWLCYATVFECSSAEDTPTRDELKSEINMTPGGIDFIGKRLDFSGMVTFNSLSWDAQNKINTAQGAADSANATLNRLGGLAYDNAVTLAKLDSTIIEGGYIKTNLINARAIVTGVLSAEAVTAGNLTVTGNSKIGGFSVSGNDLVNSNLGASISISDSTNDRYVRIGRGSNIVDIASYGSDVTGLYVLSNNPAGTGTNYAIRSYGRHVFGQRNGDVWNAPGVLWCGRYNTESGALTSWGDGTASSPSIRRIGTGCYTVTHNIGHTQYFVSATPCIYTGAWNKWAMTSQYDSIGNSSFNLQFKNDGGRDEDPKEFTVIIYGRNRF